MVRPICLPLNDDRNSYLGANAFVAGWGLIQYGTKNTHILHEIQVPIVQNNVCQSVYTNQIDHGIICAGGDGKDVCLGDSGGPLMTAKIIKGIVYYYQIGIAIFNDKCTGEPFASTYIPFALNWINRSIAQNQ